MLLSEFSELTANAMHTMPMPEILSQVTKVISSATLPSEVNEAISDATFLFGVNQVISDAMSLPIHMPEPMSKPET